MLPSVVLDAEDDGSVGFGVGGPREGVLGLRLPDSNREKACFSAL